MTQAYPLHWPEGWPRTPSHRRRRAQFKTAQHIAQLALMDEIKRLEGSNVILSTNMEIKRDGLPYVNQKRLQQDPGVAVYFELKGHRKCFACDRWDSLADNIQAIRKTIEALRGIDRWGSGDMVEAAFRGFDALPPPPSKPHRHWAAVLDVFHDAQLPEIEQAYKKLAMSAHPDNGGNHEFMVELNAAIAQARKERAA